MGERRKLVGRVTSVNPARREIRVKSPVLFGLDVESIGTIFIAVSDGEEVCCRAERCRVHAGQLIIELSAGVLRDTVAQLYHGAVSVNPDEVSIREHVGFDAERLLGFVVETNEGQRVGRVSAVIDTPAHDVLEVETPSGACMLAPLVEAMVVSVDWDNETVRVRDWSAFAVHQEAGPSTRNPSTRTV